ncbi:MAG: PTS sugar transporter subunit IIA [Planctomycetes bacterium]|nr:PTS sugar transporter subunit IIA [Planctomycetota bacterium]
MTFWKEFKSKSCSSRLKAADKEQALAEIVDLIVKGGELDSSLRDEALSALLAREQMASTGVGMNVAIPHVKLKGIDKVICSLCVSRTGLDWNSIDGDPVNILFVVLRPERATDSHAPEEHIERMSWIARLSREADFRRFVQKTNTKAEMLGLLKEMSAV